MLEIELDFYDFKVCVYRQEFYNYFQELANSCYRKFFINVPDSNIVTNSSMADDSWDKQTKLQEEFIAYLNKKMAEHTDSREIKDEQYEQGCFRAWWHFRGECSRVMNKAENKLVKKIIQIKTESYIKAQILNILSNRNRVNIIQERGDCAKKNVDDFISIDMASIFSARAKMACRVRINLKKQLKNYKQQSLFWSDEEIKKQLPGFGKLYELTEEKQSIEKNNIIATQFNYEKNKNQIARKIDKKINKNLKEFELFSPRNK